MENKVSHNFNWIAKFSTQRGYSYSTLQLISLDYYKKGTTSPQHPFRLFYDKKDFNINFTNETKKIQFNLKMLAYVFTDASKENLILFLESTINPSQLNCHLFSTSSLENIRFVVEIIQSHTNKGREIPEYISDVFRQGQTIQTTLDCLMRKQHIEEALVVSTTIIPINEYQEKEFLYRTTKYNNLMPTDQKRMNSFEIHSIRHLIDYNNLSTKDSEHESVLVAKMPQNFIYLILTGKWSLQFINTQTKVMEVEIFYWDIIELIRSNINNNEDLMILLKNNLESNISFLEMIHLRFCTSGQYNKFYEDICTKAEQFMKAFKNCSECPSSFMNNFCFQLSDITNEFKYLFSEEINNPVTLVKISNIISSQFDNLKNLSITNDPYLNVLDKIMSIFNQLRIYYETIQIGHECCAMKASDILKSGPIKLWNNMKSLFVNKLPSTKSSSSDKPDVYQFILSQDSDELQKSFNTEISEELKFESNESLQKSLSSPKRHLSESSIKFISNSSNASSRSNSIIESSLFKTSELSKLSKELLKMNRYRFKSIGYLVLFCLFVKEKSKLNWNFSEKYISELKGQRSTVLAKMFECESAIDTKGQWNNRHDFFSNEKEKSSFLNHLIDDEIESDYRRRLWNILINNSADLKIGKIFEHKLTDEFEVVLKSLINSEDRFQCKEALAFYKKSFCQINRSNADILNDVGRTLPQVPYFGANFEGQVSLYNVLRAYALIDPDVAYCQGMNFIASIFLLYMNEEDSFITLIFFMVFLEQRDMYIPSMIGMTIKFYKLERLIFEFCPSLKSHLTNLNFPISIYASSWFMTLFSTSYPLKFVVKVFDLLLACGPNIIFNLCIILISQVGDQIQRLSDFDDVYECLCMSLNQLTDEQFTAILHKAATLDLTKNLQTYDIEYEYSVEQKTSNDFLQNLCRENTNLKMENNIFRKKIEFMQREIIELRQKLSFQSIDK